jgi:hypothetical protein
MDNLQIAQLTLVVSSFSTLLIGVYVALLLRQIKETHEWNRRKTSQEILTNLTTGEFPDLRQKLELDFMCNVMDGEETYESVASRWARQDEKKKLELDYALKRLLNIFETVSINMKNHMIDEDICYDYLGDIAVQYSRWSKAFIEEGQRANPKAWEVFVDYTNRWSERIKLEEEKRKESVMVSGRRKL